ncbi:hypothetical protein HDV01_007080 [Terramyces sp. JEL0728]|nr:hypothetical protein HDV01_007080 [Terramyces sp. JEL0728]
MTKLEDKIQNLKITQKDRKALDDLTINNIGQLKTIIKYCFETPIEDDFLQNESRLGENIAIKVLAVLPAYRKNGLAKMLLEELIESARTKKYDILETKPMYVTAESGIADDYFVHFGFEQQDDRLVYSL